MSVGLEEKSEFLREDFILDKEILSDGSLLNIWEISLLRFESV